MMLWMLPTRLVLQDKSLAYYLLNLNNALLVYFVEFLPYKLKHNTGGKLAKNFGRFVHFDVVFPVILNEMRSLLSFTSC